MAIRSAVFLISSLAISGCAINQTVKPVEHFADKQVCVIDNPAVREGFIESYKRALAAKGYEARQPRRLSSNA